MAVADGGADGGAGRADGGADGTGDGVRRWEELAACRGMDPELFHPKRGESNASAKAVCRGCAVRLECLTRSLEECERLGVWGGTSERDRRSLRRWLGVPGYSPELIAETVVSLGLEQLTGREMRSRSGERGRGTMPRSEDEERRQG